VRGWLAVQGALLLFGALAFGLVFPFLGLFLGAVAVAMSSLQLAPLEEGPLGAAMAMVCAGPITALFYAPGGVLGLLAARRYQPGRLGWVIAAAVGGAPVCSAVAFVPLVFAVVDRSSASGRSYPGASG
jgi:hypothetical protein